MALPGNRGISFRVLERKFKDWLMLRLSAAMRPQQMPRVPDWASRPHRVLVLRYDRIGDMILSTGIIKGIALAQPTVAIDILASSGNAVVLAGSPYVASILTINRRRPWTWIVALVRMRRARYDAVIDVMVMAPSLTTMLIMWLSGARHRIGLGDRGHESAFTLPVARLRDAVHYVDHSAALLAAFGVDSRSLAKRPAQSDSAPEASSGRARIEDTGIGGWGIWRPEIFLTSAEIARGEARWPRVVPDLGSTQATIRRLVVNVSAGGAWRYWPSACFIEVLTVVRSMFPGLECVLIGSPHDADRMEDIGRATGAVVAHTAGVREIMPIIATSDVVFTADTAVTHIASAFKKPTVAMYARGKARLWGPYDVPGRAVSTPGPSLDSLDVASVLPALIEVVAAATRTAGNVSASPVSRASPQTFERQEATTLAATRVAELQSRESIVLQSFQRPRGSERASRSHSIVGPSDRV